MAELLKNGTLGTNDEVHGYDSLDRLEGDLPERSSGISSPRVDSAYDQWWVGEEGLYPAK